MSDDVKFCFIHVLIVTNLGLRNCSPSGETVTSTFELLVYIGEGGTSAILTAENLLETLQTVSPSIDDHKGPDNVSDYLLPPPQEKP